MTNQTEKASEWEQGQSSEKSKHIDYLHSTLEIISHVKSSKNNVEDILDVLPDAILIVDCTGRILKLNRVAEALLKDYYSTLFMSKISDIFDPSDWQQIAKHIEQLSFSTEAMKPQAEFIFSPLHGSLKGRHFRWTVGRIPNISLRRGVLVYLVGSDITEIQGLCLELKAKHLEVEAHAVELAKLLETVQIQKINIFESARLAQLGELAGGIAHEINNPVAIIKGYADLLRDMLDAPNIDRKALLVRVGQIISTADRIRDIVVSMRMLSRDTSVDDFQSENIGQLIKQTLILFQKTAKFGNIQLRILDTGPGGDGALQCRGGQISQILINLLENSCQAVTDLEEKWVEIGWTDNGSEIEVMVADSGPRIPAAIIDKVMQPFFTTRPPGSGTGLGLSISKTIAEAHGGGITVDRKAVNTIFRVTLQKNTQS